MRIMTSASIAELLSADSNRLILRVAVRHNGENLLWLFTRKEQFPSVVLRWKGLYWYHPLVKDF